MASGLTPLTVEALALEVQTLRSRLIQLEERYTGLSPLYSLAQAAALLPCLPRTLMYYLARHRARLDAPMYRHDKRPRRYRMLSHHDLVTLRSVIIRRTGHRTRAQAVKALEVSAA